jgi:hypothetical protein
MDCGQISSVMISEGIYTKLRFADILDLINITTPWVAGFTSKQSNSGATLIEDGVSMVDGSNF